MNQNPNRRVSLTSEEQKRQMRATFKHVYGITLPVAVSKKLTVDQHKRMLGILAENQKDG